MSDTSHQDTAKPTKIDLKREIAKSEWKEDPVIGFEQKASLAIARWVLIIFGGVYALSFAAMIFLFSRTDATFEKGSELVKFMVQSLLPLVTLAVGYYLGDRNRPHVAPRAASRASLRAGERRSWESKISRCGG